MRRDGCWGGNCELVAASRLYQRSIRVYSTSSINSGPITIDPHDNGDDDDDDDDDDVICVSYHGNDHYNSIRLKNYQPTARQGRGGRRQRQQAKSNKTKDKKKKNQQHQNSKEEEEKGIVNDDDSDDGMASLFRQNLYLTTPATDETTDDGDDHDAEIIVISDETMERREAEFEFISAAYTSEEAWVIVKKNTNGKNCRQKPKIHRRLELPITTDNDITDTDNNNGIQIPIELILTVPHNYPNDIDSVLEVDAHLITNSNTRMIPNGGCSGSGDNTTMKNVHVYRKLVMDALPKLVQACRTVTKENAGCESVFIVIARAEEWIDDEWRNDILPSFLALQQQQQEEKEKERRADQSNNASSTIGDDDDGNDVDNNTEVEPKVSVTICRKLLYSGHISSQTLRQTIQDLSYHYELGGYYTIGEPGILIVEGERSNVTYFVDEILASMPLQERIEVRGTQHEEVQLTIQRGRGCGSVRDQKRNCINDYRKFTTTTISNNNNNDDKNSDTNSRVFKMIELSGEDQNLSTICTEVGLVDLFLSSMANGN